MAAPIPTNEYYNYTDISNIAISPDGEVTCFEVQEFSEAENARRHTLFIVPTDGTKSPYRLTRLGDARDPAWSPEGSQLAFRGTREHQSPRELNGDSNGSGSESFDSDTSQVYVFDLDRGGDPRRVTTRPEGVDEFDWAPDGERIVSVSRDPTAAEQEYLERLEEGGPLVSNRLQHKFDGHGWLDSATRYVFVHDLQADEERRLDTGIVSGTGTLMVGSSVKWSPDGTRIAFATNRSSAPDDSLATDIHTISPDGSELECLTSGEMLVSELEWGPEGDRIAFKGQAADDWYKPPELFLIDLPSQDTFSLTRQLDRTISRNASARWISSNRLLTLVGDEGLTRFAQVPTDGESWISLARQGEYRTIDRFDYNAGTLVCTVSSPQNGTDLFTLELDDLEAGPDAPDPLNRLSSINQNLLDRYGTSGGCQRFTFESDGEPIEGLVFYPSTCELDDHPQLPAILNIHGGPQSYDSPRYNFVNRFWTSRGYLLANVNYRGSTSYGREFCGALKGHWNDRDVKDQLACVHHLIKEGWAHPDRVFVTGFSYGGTSTARLVIRSDVFAAAAAEHGVYDLRSAFGTDDAHLWYENQHGLPWERTESYDELSSILDVEAIATPMLVTAGSVDWRCAPTQAEQLHVSLQKVGVESKLVIYQDEHHDVVAPKRAIHRLNEIADWFEQHDPYE